jgi:hypothetical protein
MSETGFYDGQQVIYTDPDGEEHDADVVDESPKPGLVVVHTEKYGATLTDARNVMAKADA